MKSAFVTVCGHTVQRGAALVIALILLVILTLLAVTGMRMSVAELAMAGNEQFRHKASTASSAGIEVAIARVSARGGPASGEVERVGPVSVGEPRRDSYTVSVRYTGREASLPGSSAERFFGDHLEIQSVGVSSRSARDVQAQGVMVISPAQGVKSFQRTGTGLASEGAP